ncbi:MAG: hypothetical protein GTN81_10285 [Proteobacteria bacterium]|nr:hypothetical protein [Pseudomonadota bacterium]
MKTKKLLDLSPLFGLLFLLFFFFGVFDEMPAQAQSASASIDDQDASEARRLTEAREDEDRSADGQTFYKWDDENGDLYITNDLAKVPQRFRDHVETLQFQPLQEVGLREEERSKPESIEPPSSRPIVTDREGDLGRQRVSAEPSPYKEIPFDKFIRIQIGMDEAEVLSRLGFPSLVTPSDYFGGYHRKYRSRLIRLIYLGNRDLNEKTTVIEIRDGKVVNVERIFPF